jgi:DME family drug/metabolite transporter
MLSVSPVVYALAAITAVLWGFAPVLDRQGMDAGGTTVQASTVVVVVDSLLYWVALLALQGFDAFADLSLATLRLFLAAGFVGTALGRLAVFAGVRRVGVALIVVGGVLVALG